MTFRYLPRALVPFKTYHISNMKPDGGPQPPSPSRLVDEMTRTPSRVILCLGPGSSLQQRRPGSYAGPYPCHDQH